MAFGTELIPKSSTFYPAQKVVKRAVFRIISIPLMGMDNIQFWIWLIVIVVTLIARANKKKPKTFNPDSSGESDRSEPATKPISFEDLLREIQAAKQPKQVQPAVPPVTYKPTYEVDYDDDLKEEAEAVEKTDYRSEDEIYETYERAKREAFQKPSLEETLKVDDTKVTFEQFNRYKSKKRGSAKVMNEYVQELKNPTSFKKAFILSEVLKKRF